MSTEIDNRVFSGKFPAGILYADRKREKHGDYAWLAFLSYSTLELKFEKDCPEKLKQGIIEDAAEIQKMKGQLFEISSCGQTVLLGSAIATADAC